MMNAERVLASLKNTGVALTGIAGGNFCAGCRPTDHGRLFGLRLFSDFALPLVNPTFLSIFEP